MTVTQIVPEAATIDIDQLISNLRQRPALQPFDKGVMELCADISQRLFRDAEAKAFPELQALAFWMRKAELVRMAQEFRSLETEATVMVPRGLVFHVPPSNVDTIFVYSWLLAVLTGNINLIRISSRESAQTNILIRILQDAVANRPEEIRNATTIVQYPRDESINGALSLACDVRVVWGGDATVESFRKLPLSPHGKDLAFPDRYSFAAIRSDAYSNLGDEQRDALAQNFFNDTFWFDQMACSSPRLVIWCGPREESKSSSADLFRRLLAVIEKRQLQIASSTALNKFAFACRAILDQGAETYVSESNMTVLDLPNLDLLQRVHCGGGLLLQCAVSQLSDVEQFIARKDQTVTAFGWSADELRTFVRSLRGRGVDRIVPIGQALQFNRYWDGYDLFVEFTRTVYVR